MTREEEKQESKQMLKKYLKEGSTIYCCLAHVSQSGMTRDIKLMVVHKKDLISLNWYVSKLLGYSLKNNGVRIGGCGMDMGFALVDHVQHALKFKRLHHRWI